MINLDWLKLRTRAKYIKHINEDEMHIDIKSGAINHYHYHSKKGEPYLHIYINDNTAFIEFSGKILSDDYISLISHDNILQCLQAINDKGICELDVTSIYEDSIVSKCHVTNDVDFYGDIDWLFHDIRMSVKDYNRCTPKRLNNGLYLITTPNTVKYHTEFCIYDKAREMLLSHNRPFLESINDKSNVISHFQNKLRFEMKLNSETLVRKHFKSSGLKDVLMSDLNPLSRFIEDELMSRESQSGKESPNDLMRFTLVEHFGFDMEKVESYLRLTIPNFRPSRHLKPIQEAYFKHLSLRTWEVKGLLLEWLSDDDSTDDVSQRLAKDLCRRIQYRKPNVEILEAS